MIHNLEIDINANPATMKDLSAEEICEFCLYFNNKILIYFKDILFGKLAKERSLLYKCHTTMQWYLGMLGRIASKGSDKNPPQLKIHQVTGINDGNSTGAYGIQNIRILFELDSDLGTTSLIGIDPNIIVQILDVVNRVCINSLQSRLTAPREVKLIGLCRNKVNYLAKHLRLVTDSLLVVNEKSYVHRLMVKVETTEDKTKSQ